MDRVKQMIDFLEQYSLEERHYTVLNSDQTYGTNFEVWRSRNQGWFFRDNDFKRDLGAIIRTDDPIKAIKEFGLDEAQFVGWLRHIIATEAAYVEGSRKAIISIMGEKFYNDSFKSMAKFNKSLMKLVQNEIRKSNFTLIKD